LSTLFSAHPCCSTVKQNINTPCKSALNVLGVNNLFAATGAAWRVINEKSPFLKTIKFLKFSIFLLDNLINYIVQYIVNEGWSKNIIILVVIIICTPSYRPCLPELAVFSVINRLKAK